MHVGQELPNGTVQHGTAPHDRLPLRHEEPHRHDLHAVSLVRHHLAVPDRQRALQAHHDGHVGTVDIGVHDADTGPLQGQADRHVHAERRLADPALAAADGQHGANVHIQLLGHPWIAHHLMRKLELDRIGVGKGLLDRSQAIALDLGLHRAGRRCQLDLEGHAPVLNPDVLDHVQGHEILFKLRFNDVGQGQGHGFDSQAGNCRIRHGSQLWMPRVRGVIKAQWHGQGQFAPSLCLPGTLPELAP